MSISATTRTHANQYRPRSILITGCSSGIGKDAAKTLHAQGWQVLATCRKATDCQALSSAGLNSHVLDLADSDSVQSGAAWALEQSHGQLDAVFNNGAFAVPGLVADLPRNALKDIFETNLFGQFELINAVLPAMLAAKRGTIVNNSSVLGFAAMRYRGAYNATKFAMEGLTDTLRLELYDTPINVVLIQPGPIDTRIRVNSQPHFERWIDVEHSSQRSAYENELIPRLYSTDPSAPKDYFELPPSAVTAVLIKSLESPRPRARYRVTTPTRLAAIFKRLLSSRAFDRLTVRR